MHKLLELGGVKVLLFVLTMLLFAVCIASGLTAVYMANQWYYEPETVDVYDTADFYRFTRLRAFETARLWSRAEESGAEAGYDVPVAPLYRAYTTNFAYQVVGGQDGGQVLGSNLLPDLSYREMGEFLYDEVRVRGYVQSPLHVEDEYMPAARLFYELFPYRWGVIIVLGTGSVLLVVALFLLCASAGRRRGVEGFVLGLQDRIPLDLYLSVAGIMAFLLLYFAYESLYGWSISLREYTVTGILFFLCCVVGTAGLLTLAARYKAGRWWRNTVLYRVFHPLGEMVGQLARALPLIWQVMLCCLAVEAVSFVLVVLAVEYLSIAPLLLYCLLHAALFLAVGFVALGMQRLKTMGERIAAGELDHRPDLRRMPHSFCEHAETLGRIGEGLSAAVAQRLRSERLKTELITNVSHDIKTPLTSIVNYVDLLGRQELDGEAGEYVEVLGRQAARLKKLTEDLVEASKATTGSVEVHLARTGLCELLGQAVAEYADRLVARELEPVMELPEGERYALADGRHLWRVMDNLLGNVCKYAQPGTRVYIELEEGGGAHRIAVKNISRARLNIDADELMERFVRGDGARASEGSGLGLHIARSLAELQNGSLSLTVDGDLFKAQVTLPAAPDAAVPDAAVPDAAAPAWAYDVAVPEDPPATWEERPPEPDAEPADGAQAGQSDDAVDEMPGEMEIQIVGEVYSEPADRGGV